MASLSYPIHPLAEIFPEMTGSAYRELVADIRLHGLREPITLINGSVLDGRNRQRACEDAAVEPRFEVFDGTDPLGFVISRNLIRRHLREGQRALVAAGLASMKQGARNDLNRGYAVSQAEAAQLLNISARSLQSAVAVRRCGDPDLLRMVAGGAVSISAAAAVSRLPPAERKQVVSARPSRIVAQAHAPSRRARSEYAGLWSCVDAACAALERRSLVDCRAAASDLIRQIEAIAANRRAES